MATGAELPIDRGASAEEMAETIFGDDVIILGARYDGDRNSSGTYSNGDAISGGVTPGNEGVILSTGRVQDFTRGGGDPNRSGSTSTNTSGDNGNPFFEGIAGPGVNTFDASFLEVEFEPSSDFLSIQFTFASEEYPEFSGSIFNDAVGIWANGSLVTSPVFNITQINSVNQNENETLFINNTGDDYNTEMDGFTVTLSVLIPVMNGQPNTLMIGIADVGDSGYDSAILIAAGSVQGQFLAQDDALALFGNREGVIDVLANDGTVNSVVMITHINGQEVGPGDSIVLASGHRITLTADGQLSVVGPEFVAGAPTPTVNFSYTAIDQNGITDTAFVTVETIPCFVEGTRIRAENGQVAVEDLRVGDLVDTRDNGLQPLRWIGRRTVAAEGRFAPVVIEAGTFGHHRRLTVSPQHRVMLTHWMAELMFGEDEVLVAAKDLVNGVSVRECPGGEVTYFHLLFDDHQILWSEGLLTESFLPGPQVLGSLDAAVRHEVLELFPEIDPDTHHGYGPAARPALRGFEARALLG